MPDTSRKQPNSRMCFICGMKNIAGLKTFFYEQPDGTVLARPVVPIVDLGVADAAGQLSFLQPALMQNLAKGRQVVARQCRLQFSSQLDHSAQGASSLGVGLGVARLLGQDVDGRAGQPGVQEQQAALQRASGFR